MEVKCPQARIIKGPAFAGPFSYAGGNHLGRCFVEVDMRKVLGLIALGAVTLASFVFPGAAVSGENRESRRKLVAEEHYGCGEHYPAKVFWRRKGAENGKHPANQKLKDLLQSRRDEIVPGPRHGWIRAYRKNGRAEFVHERRSRKAYFYIDLEKGEKGWRWSGSGTGCKPLAWGPKTSGGTIKLRDGHPPKPEDTRLRVLVQEWACHGYRVPKREDVHPRIIYGEENVIVILRIEYPQGGATCPGTPPFRYTVKLDEQLGDRALVDGGLYPPRVCKEAPAA